MPVPLHGQVAVSSTPQPLSPTPAKAVAFSIDAPVTNVATVYIGSSTVSSSNGYPIQPGDGLDYERNDQAAHVKYILNVSDVYVVGTAGDVIGWFGTPAQS